jgi:hypothetical protein
VKNRGEKFFAPFFLFLIDNQLQRASAALFHEDLFPFDEFFFDAVFVMADGK